MTKPRYGAFQKHRIHLTTYNYALWLVVGDPKRTLALMRNVWELTPATDDLPSPESFARCRGRCCSRGPDHCVFLWFPRVPRTPREIATVAHEALHAVGHILDQWACVKYDSNNDEPYTHLLACIVAESLARMRRVEVGR
jgi:hypothetical protein